MSFHEFDWISSRTTVDDQSVGLQYSLVIYALEGHLVELRALLRSEVLRLAGAVLK